MQQTIGAAQAKRRDKVCWTIGVLPSRSITTELSDGAIELPIVAIRRRYLVELTDELVQSFRVLIRTDSSKYVKDTSS